VLGVGDVFLDRGQRAVPPGIDVGGVALLQPAAVQVVVRDDVGDRAALIGGGIVGPVAVGIGVGVVVIVVDRLERAVGRTRYF